VGKLVPIKSKQKAQEIAQRMAVVDELGALDAQIAALGPKIRRAESLRKQVQGWADADFPADQNVVFEGASFLAEASAKGNRREIADMEGVFKRLGRSKFFEVCQVALKRLDELLTAAEAAAVLKESRSGPRSVKTLARATPLAKAS
jgi:hypothetical protein